MAASRMTLSTVALGKGADTKLLARIAQTGGGRYYHTNDPSSVPQIFVKETMVASRSAINEEPFLPRLVRATAALEGIDLKSAPFLLGYVITRAKPTSEVILMTENGEPLLAWWRYGLGMSVAFTSDAKSQWASEWISWDGFSRFWAQIVRHSMRRGQERGFMVQLDRKGGRSRIKVDAVTSDGRFINRVETSLTILDPQLERHTLKLDQTAPGRYEATFETKLTGPYHLEVSQKQGSRLVNRQSRGLIVGYPDEIRLRPTNSELLSSLAAVTGGTYDLAPTQAFAHSGETAERALKLWPLLLTVALLLFVLDVALRRLDLDPRSRAGRA
jgi:hypothetical protein